MSEEKYKSLTFTNVKTPENITEIIEVVTSIIKSDEDIPHKYSLNDRTLLFP